LLIPSVRWLYDYAWFMGFFVSGGLYYLMMQWVPKRPGD
jgi:NCS1 family nucleobase:cation symporter-1